MRIRDSLEIDLDGPYVLFPDGAVGAVNGDYDCGVLPETQVRLVPLAALDAALGAIAESEMMDTWVIDTDPPDRAYEVEPMEGVAFYTQGEGDLCALIDLNLPRYVDEALEARVDDLLAPMMERLGARASAPSPSTPDRFFSSGDYIVRVEFTQMSEKTAGDLLDMALAVQAFLKAARNGKLTKAVARDLLRSGHFATLIGQPESDWLEAKNQLWDLSTDRGKAEAAKDLSAFANADGGLIVVPAKTASEAGRDVIVEVKELPLDRLSETQVRDTIAQWTFPPLRDVEIDVIDTGNGRGQVIIAVPSHRAEDWPHLVIAPPGAAFEAAAIAAYVRDGDKNRALTAAQLHRLMAERFRHAVGSPPVAQPKISETEASSKPSNR